MTESKKTRQALLHEITLLKRKLAAATKIKKFGGNMIQQKQPRQSPRRQIKADIEFIGDFDIVKAHGVNISRGGICLKLDKNMPFEMKLYQGNKQKTYRAELVWLKQLKEGEYHIGFKFINDTPLPEF